MIDSCTAINDAMLRVTAADSKHDQLCAHDARSSYHVCCCTFESCQASPKLHLQREGEEPRAENIQVTIPCHEHASIAPSNTADGCFMS